MTTQESTPSFARDIKPLFRTRDRDHESLGNLRLRLSLIDSAQDALP